MSERLFIISVDPGALQVRSRDESRIYLSVVPDGILPEREAIEFFNDGVSRMVLSLMGYPAGEEARLEDGR